MKQYKLKNSSEPWLVDSRRSAEEKYQSISEPGLKDENFKFTPLKFIRYRDDYQELLKDSSGYALPDTEVASAKSGELAVCHIETRQFMSPHREGEFSGRLYFSDLLNAAEEGVLAELPGWNMSPFLENDLFAQLVAARWQNGFCLVVPRGVRLELPLRSSLFFNENNKHFLFRNLIVLEEGSECVYIDDWTSDHQGEENSFIGGLVQVYAASGSRLNYVSLQQWGDRVQHFVRHELRAQKDAHIQYSLLDVGGAKGQARVECICSEPGSHIELDQGVFGQESQHFDSWICSRHDVPDSKTTINHSTIMDGRSKAIFNGLIWVTPQAFRTEALQKNKNMMLSSRASVESLPKLQIALDEVQVSHGSSTSYFDEEQIFYLQSRGLERKEAETLLLWGFAEPLVQKLPTQSLQNRLRKAIQEKFSWELKKNDSIESS